MAGERVKLEVRSARARGSADSRRLRNQGSCPASSTGAGKPPQPFCVHERELRRALTGDSGLHAILDVVLDGQGTHAPGGAQGVPAGSAERHASRTSTCTRSGSTSRSRRRSSVELIGEPAGVKEGGVLSQVQREMNVEALPMEIPDHLELDVSGMAIGDTLRLADLPAQEGVTYLDDPEETVLATVTMPTRLRRARAGRGRGRGARRGRAARGRGGSGGRGGCRGRRSACRGRGRRGRRGRRRAAAVRGLGAPLRVGASGLDTRPARRRAGQPGARVRAHAPQRRLAGGGRARAAARRLVSLEVLRAARGGPRRRAQARPAQAGDLHERVRASRSAPRRASSRFDPDALLVVHDDVDLEPGRLQVRLGGGLAGHNGLRSIASTLGTQDFLRLRIGVGRPGRGDRRPVADYVLSEFEPRDRRRGARLPGGGRGRDDRPRRPRAAQQRFN